MADEKVSLDDLRLAPEDRADPGGGRRSRGWIVLAVIVAVALLATFFLLRSRSAPTVTVAEVREVEVAASGESVLQASGYVTARRQATVSAKVTGKVTEVLVEEGMRVEEGQVLARLDDSRERRQLALAEARLKAARSAVEEMVVRLAEAELNLRRSRELTASDVTSQASLDADQAAADALRARITNARDEVTVAEREVALSRQQVEDMVVRAPFTGVAVSKDAQPGEMISPISAGGGFTRTGISTLVDMSSLEIEVDVNEAYIGRVHPGQRAEAVLDAWPEWTIPAHVIITIPAADRQKATVRVRIAFEEIDPRILPDMGVKVSFFEEAEARDGSGPRRRLVAPRSALVREGERQIVFVLGAEGKAERRAVTVGRINGEQAEIEAGLSGGETVILTPPEGLADGDPVRIQGGG